MILILILSILLAVSFGANAFFFLKQKYLPKPPPRKETIDAQELLHDLLSGQALVSIHRIAPSDVLLRSPRSRQ